MSQPVPSAATNESISIKEAAKWWWLPLLQGIAALVLAAALLLAPLKTLVAMTYWLGLYWLVDGVLNALRALRGNVGQSRLLLLLAGAIGVVAGAAMMMHPALAGLISLNFMMSLFAASMLVNGVILILAGRPSGVSAQRTRSWGSFLIGVLYVVGGILLFMNPGMTLATLLYLFVFWALLVGAGLIWAAFELKRLGQTA